MSDEPQTGPCILCSAQCFPLSYGGPQVCPECDARPASLGTVQRLRAEVARLSALVPRWVPARDAGELFITTRLIEPRWIDDKTWVLSVPIPPLPGTEP